MTSLASVFVEVRPDTSGFSGELKSKLAAARSSVDVAANLDTSKLKPQLAALKADLKSIALTKARVDADTSRVSAQIRGVKAELATLSKRVKVEGDTSDLTSAIRAAKAELAAMTDKKVRLDVDAGMASAHLKELRAQLALFGANDETVHVNVDTDRALTGINTLTAAALALGPALAPLAAFSAGGLVALGPALLAGAAAAAVAAVAFRGVGDALTAMSNHQAKAGQEAVAQASAERSAASQVASAQAGVANARRQAAQGASAAAAAVRQAAQGVANAERENAQASKAAASAVRQAQQGVADAVREAARATRDAAEAVKSAEKDVADAHRDAARAVRDAAEAVRDAQRGVVDAERAAARAAQDARDAVVRARQGVKDATERAAEGVQSALRSQSRAEDDLASAQRDAVNAQDDLNKAREDAQKKLARYQDQLKDASLNERDAQLAVAEARKQLYLTNNDPRAGAIERAQAQLTYEERVQQLKELQDSNKDLQAEAADAAKKGVDGSDEVVSAQQRQVDAIKAVADAQQNLKDATADVIKAQVDGAREVKDAQDALKDAQQAQADQAVENAERIREAQERLAKALRDQARAQADAAERVASAEDNLRKALRAQAEQEADNQRSIKRARDAVAQARQAQVATEISNSQRLKAAQEGLARARQAQAAQAASSAASVAGAQRQLADALANQKKVNDQVSASQQTLNEKMAALGPSGRAFVRFLSSLGPLLKPLQEDAQGGLFTGLTAGIKAALPALPVFRSAVRGISGALGDAAHAMGQFIGGPFGQSFIQFIGRTAPPMIRQFSRIMRDVAVGAGAMAAAFLPVTRMMLNGLERLAEGFASFSLRGGFKPLVDYMVKNGPEIASILGRVGQALGRLVVAAIPIGTVILRGLVGLADVINGLPIPVLTGLVGTVAGLVTVIYAANVALRISALVTNAWALASSVAAVASKAWAGAQWLLNAALTANPIGIVVVALGALVAGLVVAYKHSETFRDIVNKAFKALKDVAETTIRWVRQNWPTILAVLTGPIGAATIYIVRHWDTIRGAFQAAKDWVAGRFKSAWAVVQTVLTAPVSAGRVVINQLLGAGGAVRDIFNGIKEWAAGAFRSAWAVVRAVFVDPVQAAREGINNLLGGGGKVRDIFNGVRDWVRDVWSASWAKIKDWITNPIESARDAIQNMFGKGGPFRTAFQAGVDAIGAIWDGLKEKAKAPIKFLIDVVYNKGIRGVVNAIPGVKNLPELTIKGFAGGGWTGPGSKLKPAGIVHADEHVWTKEEMSKFPGGHPAMEKMREDVRKGDLHGPLSRPRGWSEGGRVTVLPGYFLGGGVKPAAGAVSRHSGYPWATWAGDINEPGNTDTGHPVVAWKNGIVASTRHMTTSYGNHVRINHPGGEQTLYAHLLRWVVGENQGVRAGQKIGEKDSTGNSSGPHLHFEVKGGGDPSDTGGPDPSGNATTGNAVAQAVHWVTDVVKHLNPLRFLDLGGWKDKLSNLGAWGGYAADMVGHVGGQFKDWAVGKIMDAFPGAKGVADGGDTFTTETRHAVSSGGGGGPANNGPSPGGAGGADHLVPIIRAARNYAQARWGPMTIYGYANRNIAGTNTISDHALGKALDFMVPLGNKATEIQNYFSTGPGYGRFNMENIIHNHRIYNRPRGWHAYSGSNPHTDHVHVDTFDQGGIARGPGAFVTKTLRPERVLSPRQTESFDRLVALLEQQGVAGASAPLINNAVIRETVDLERYERQRAFRDRMANVSG